jgi:hypothetical protein
LFSSRVRAPRARGLAPLLARLLPHRASTRCCLFSHRAALRCTTHRSTSYSAAVASHLCLRTSHHRTCHTPPPLFPFLPHMPACTSSTTHFTHTTSRASSPYVRGMA